MYRHGGLTALGLEESQFPTSTPDALWFAYQGWLSSITRVIPLVPSTWPIQSPRLRPSRR